VSTVVAEGRYSAGSEARRVKMVCEKREKIKNEKKIVYFWTSKVWIWIRF
jgi:hypothetical protein